MKKPNVQYSTLNFTLMCANLEVDHRVTLGRTNGKTLVLWPDPKGQGFYVGLKPEPGTYDVYNNSSC